MKISKRHQSIIWGCTFPGQYPTASGRATLNATEGELVNNGFLTKNGRFLALTQKGWAAAAPIAEARVVAATAHLDSAVRSLRGTLESESNSDWAHLVDRSREFAEAFNEIERRHVALENERNRLNHFLNMATIAPTVE